MSNYKESRRLSSVPASYQQPPRITVTPPTRTYGGNTQPVTKENIQAIEQSQDFERSQPIETPQIPRQYQRTRERLANRAEQGEAAQWPPNKQPDFYVYVVLVKWNGDSAENGEKPQTRFVCHSRGLACLRMDEWCATHCTDVSWRQQYNAGQIVLDAEGTCIIRWKEGYLCSAQGGDPRVWTWIEKTKVHKKWGWDVPEMSNIFESRRVL